MCVLCSAPPAAYYLEYLLRPRDSANPETNPCLGILYRAATVHMPEITQVSHDDTRCFWKPRALLTVRPRVISPVFLNVPEPMTM